MDVSGLVATGLGLCFEVASALYSYGKDVKAAKKEIRDLSNELFGLIGALEHLKYQDEHHALIATDPSEPPSYDEIEKARTNEKSSYDDLLRHGHSGNVRSVLEQTLELLQELYETLVKPKDRIGVVIQRLKWPLQEKQVRGYLDRLERVKSYFILSLITDEVDQSRKAAQGIAALRAQVDNVRFEQQAAESRKSAMLGSRSGRF